MAEPVAPARHSHDDADFGTALAAELPRLARLALHLSRDPILAEDFAQEAALRAWSRQRQLRAGAPVGPWLNRILVNLVIDRSRAHHDEFAVTDIEERWHDDDYTVDPEQVLARAELRDELEDGLVRLPAGYRTVVVLHDAVGWSVSAIAETMRIGLPAAKQRLRRGRMMLVSALADGDPKRAASLAQPVGHTCSGWRRQVRRPEPSGVSESPSGRSERATSDPSSSPQGLLGTSRCRSAPSLGCHDAAARGLRRAASMPWPNRRAVGDVLMRSIHTSRSRESNSPRLTTPRT